MARKDTLIARNTNFTATRKEWILGRLESTPRALGITLDVRGWNDHTAVFIVGLETSVDGETWTPFCSMTATGNPTKNHDGTPTVANTLVISNPPANTIFRGYAKTNGATVRLDLSLVEMT